MFQESNPNKDFLLPPSFKEFLGEGHEAVILNEIIDELDIKEFIQQYSQSGSGRLAYHPRMLLKVLFYGYMNQTFSSRKLANKLRSDLGFMYISGNNQPNFRTISRFRKEKGIFLENIFTQIVLQARDLGLITFGNVSLDGTKIYANASKSKNYTIEGLDKKIKNLFDQADEIDNLEDEEYGIDNENKIPDELKTKQGRDKKKKELKEQKKKLEEKKQTINKEIQNKTNAGIKQIRINDTDVDSRMMKMKRKDWGNGYNPQNLTENQFILVTTTPNSAEDTGELIPILKKFNTKYNTYPQNNLADKGYASEENYAFLKKNNINSYIPHQKVVIDLNDYVYDETVDTYTDKENNIFRFKQNLRKEKGKKGRPRKGEILKADEIKAKVYETTLKDGKKKYLYINKNWLQLCSENDERLYGEDGKNIYKKRSGCVENVFGNIKMNLGFERFLLRGFDGVQIEWNLISLAHNLKKLVKCSIS